MPGLQEVVGSVSFGSLWKLGPQDSRLVSVFPIVDNLRLSLGLWTFRQQ